MVRNPGIHDMSCVMSISTEFSSELETTFAQTNEKKWAKTEKITWVTPPFKVMQHQVEFEGQFSMEFCSLLTDIKVFESDIGHQFEDPEDFIISRVQ